MDSGPRPLPSSAVLSGFSRFIHGEYQAYAKGLGVTVERLQSRVRVPAVFQSADGRACQSRAFRQVGQAEPHPFAHLTESDRQGAQLDLLRLWNQFVNFAVVDQFVGAGACVGASFALKKMPPMPVTRFALERSCVLRSDDTDARSGSR
jgi:hypothetical protein